MIVGAPVGDKKLEKKLQKGYKFGLFQTFGYNNGEHPLIANPEFWKAGNQTIYSDALADCTEKEFEDLLDEIIEERSRQVENT